MHEFPQTYDFSGGGMKVRSPFVIGALVGAGVALLLAPAAGRETRRRIGQTAQRMGIDPSRVVGQARRTFEGIKEDAKSAIDAGRQAIRQGRQGREQPGSWSTPTV